MSPNTMSGPGSEMSPGYSTPIQETTTAQPGHQTESRLGYLDTSNGKVHSVYLFGEASQGSISKENISSFMLKIFEQIGNKDHNKIKVKVMDNKIEILINNKENKDSTIEIEGTNFNKLKNVLLPKINAATNSQFKATTPRASDSTNTGTASLPLSSRTIASPPNARARANPMDQVLSNRTTSSNLRPLQISLNNSHSEVENAPIKTKVENAPIKTKPIIAKDASIEEKFSAVGIKAKYIDKTRQEVLSEYNSRPRIIGKSIGYGALAGIIFCCFAAFASLLTPAGWAALVITGVAAAIYFSKAAVNTGKLISDRTEYNMAANQPEHQNIAFTLSSSIREPGNLNIYKGDAVHFHPNKGPLHIQSAESYQSELETNRLKHEKELPSILSDINQNPPKSESTKS